MSFSPIEVACALKWICYVRVRVRLRAASTGAADCAA